MPRIDEKLPLMMVVSFGGASGTIRARWTNPHTGTHLYDIMLDDGRWLRGIPKQDLRVVAPPVRFFDHNGLEVTAATKRRANDSAH